MKFYFSWLLFLMASIYGFSQTGNVQGTVKDHNGLTVPGALISVEGINKSTATDFNGKFTLVDVPSGKQTITVKFIGYTTQSNEVDVITKGTITLVVQLAESSTELQGVTVMVNGTNSEAKALNTQKNNTNITNVISMDQIGKFPDSNIGDAVKRVAGITMQVDQGEARNVIVRGLSPQLNSVTLNGSRIPSAEGDNRNVQMDLIPSDMIQTIQVNKALTPDMDGDALGGSVNLITKSSPEAFRFSATGGSGLSFITDKRILNGAFLLGDRTKNDKFGWLLSASFNDRDFGSDNVEMEWDNKFEYNAGDPDDLEEEDVNPYAKEIEVREYLVQRIRRSFSANLDYKFNAENTLYFKSIYNWRDDRENRFAFGQSMLDGEDIEVGDFTLVNGELTGFPVEATRQNKQGKSGGRTKNARLEIQKMQNYSLSGNHVLNDLQLDWLASYSKAEEQKKNERYVSYATEYDAILHPNGEKPYITPVDVADADLANFELDELTEENGFTDEQDVNLFVNAKFPFSVISEQEGFFKLGAKTRMKEKTRDNSFNEYSPESDFMDVLGDIAVRDYSDADFLAGSQYQVGSFADPGYIGGLNLTYSSLFETEDKPEEYVTSNFNVKENVYAGYLLFNQNITKNFSVLAGARLEKTEVTAQGNEIVFDEDGDIEGINPVTAEYDYHNILPSVHLKYNLTDRTVLRAAWSNSLARPNYVDITPSREINREEEEIYLGNPELKPTTAMNFDFMAEHYFKSVGLVSVGVFYKNIEDFIYTFQNENADGFDVFQPMNGEKASVLGLEFSFQKKLTFLPGFAKNFSVYVNYTYLKSKAKGIRNADGEIRGNMTLPQTAPNMLNGSLGYANKYFSVRLSGNFSDAYLDELGEDDFTDRYYDKQFFLDFNANVYFSKNLSFYANLNNLTNQPLRYYQGSTSRTAQMEYYGTTLNFGVKYDFFGKK